MAVNVFWGINPNLLWIFILITMSPHSLYVIGDQSGAKGKEKSDAHANTNIGSTNAPYWNDRILDYQQIKTSQIIDTSVKASKINNEDIADFNIHDPKISKHLKINLPSDSSISKSTTDNIENHDRSLISSQHPITSRNHHSNDEHTRQHAPHQISHTPSILTSTSHNSPSTSSNPCTNRGCDHSVRTKPNPLSVKGDHGNAPTSYPHPNSPSPSITKTADIPGVPYRYIASSLHDRHTERKAYTNDREIGSNEEMNVIYGNIEIEKRASGSVSSISPSSLRGTMEPNADGANENYITSPARRTYSGRLETRVSEMENAIRRKRRVNHENLTHFGGYDFNKQTHGQSSASERINQKTAMHNNENVFDDNQYENISQYGVTNVSNTVSMPSLVGAPSLEISGTQSDHNGIGDFDDDLPNDIQDARDQNYFHRNYHHRRHRRRRRQSTASRDGTNTMGRRPQTPGQRSRNSPFGRNFGSRSRRPRPPTTTDMRRGRNMNATGEPVSLKVVVHTGQRRNYGRILSSKINSLMAADEYRMLWDYINPSGSLVRLRNDRPKDILQAFCSDILKPNTTTVVHLINPFHHRRHWESAGYVASLLATVNVPRITWGPEYIGALDKKESDFSELNISPTLHHQARALISLLVNFKWPYFAVLYTRAPGYDTFITSIKMALEQHNIGINLDEQQHGPRKFNGDGRSRSSNGRRKQRDEHRIDLLTTVEMTNTSDKDRTQRDLHTLKRTDARVVVLFCKESQTIGLLEHASQLGMMGKEYLWILTFEAVNKNQNQNAGSLPVGLLGLQYNYRDTAMREAISTAARVWLEGLRQAVQSTGTLSGKPKGLPWELPSLQCQPNSTLEWKHGHELYKFMKLSSFNDVSFNDEGQLDATNISIYNVQTTKGSRYSDKKWVEIGKWTKEGVFMKQITWPGEAPSPPSGKPQRHFLRIVTREEPPFVEYRDLNNNGSCDIFSSPCSIYLRDSNETRLSANTTQKCCTGLSIEILRKLAAALDFEFRLYEVPDFQWGTKMPDGEWNGIVGELRAGHADMGVASLTIDEDKSGAVNFSVPYMETGITFIVAIREGAVSATAFLEPYDYPSWCLILVCSVHVTGASIFLFEWLSPDGMDTGKRKTSEHRFSLFRAFWLMWAMLFGAAVTTDSPRGVSSKFLSNIWALFALVFTASYTANLAAFMITKEEFYDLSGMHDWRLQNPYSVNPPFRFATVPNGTAESNIKKNNLKMYKYMSKYSQISVEHAIKALKSQELHAFIYDASVLRYKEGKDEDCQLITVGNWYATTGYGVAFPLGSPWLEKVNKVILKLQYEGEMDRLKEFWLAGACHMKRKKSNNNKGIGNGVSSATLGILNFTSAFIFLLAGTGLAIVVFAMEFFFTWFGRKKLSSWSNKDWCHLISLSMGMTLSFRDSVREAMEAHRKAQAKQCKSVVCETRLWKAHFELKQARTEIGKLQNELDRLTIEQPGVDIPSLDGDIDQNDLHADDAIEDCTCDAEKPFQARRRHTPDSEEAASDEPHLAQVHIHNLNNGDVTKRENQSEWPACLLNETDDDEEEASVRVTLL